MPKDTRIKICSQCGTELKVYNTRVKDGYIKRDRRCPNGCTRYFTKEVIDCVIKEGEK